MNIKDSIKHRHFIRQDQLKELKEDLRTRYDDAIVEHIIPENSKIEIIITEDDDKLYAVNEKLSLWKSKESYIPVLTLLLDNRIGLKTVVVDMGAVPYVTNGADIMKPGITQIDPDIKKGDIIRISDEKNDQTLAVGKALCDAIIMEEMKQGKMIKNLHTIQDAVWEFAKEFKTLKI
jgi:PUA domain protein